MRGKFRRICLAAVIVASPLAAEEAPAWLNGLASRSLPAYPAKVNSVVLFNEERTTVLETGRLSTTTRTAIKFLNRQGGDVIFYDEYDSNSGKVRDFRAWMISPAGKVKKYGKDEILDVACAQNDVYNECRRRAVSGKRDAEAGSIFAYESVIEYQSFTNQLLFRFQGGSPVLLARFVVAPQAGQAIQAQSFNGAPPQGSPSGGAYTWQMENLPALELEPASPSILTLAPWVGVSLLAAGDTGPAVSWPEIAKKLTALNDGQFEPDEALAAKARTLVEGAANEMEKIRAIARFTQRVNYVSIQMNVAKGGGYRPHPAAETFKRLYGDCKDKANLTRAMLAAVGITAYPVAVYSGDRTHVMEEWPSLGAFNHAISAIRVGSETQAPAVLDHPRLGRLLFFDPTDPYVPPGQLPDHEQASLALVAVGTAGDLVRLPAGAPVAASRDRLVEAMLLADGSISGQFVETYVGEERSHEISSYRSLSSPDYVKVIERWVGRSIPAATATGIEAQDNDDAFVLKAKFASPRFAQHPQLRMLVFRAALLRHGDLRLLEKTRRSPVALDADALRETVRIHVPAEFKVDELPESVKIDARFGKYEATWEFEAGAVVFRRSFEMPAQTVPASQYAELKSFLDRVTNSAELPVVLVR